MAAVTTFTCVCGVQRKTTNHWVLAKVNSNSIQFMPWDWNLALSDDIIILCGEGCAAALLSRSLGEWKQLPGEARHVPAAVFQEQELEQEQHA